MLHNVRDEVRAISHELLPPKFNGLTIVQLLTAYAQKSDGTVTFLPPSTPIDLSPSDSIHLYRIVQEWTGNLRRHSDATAITISLTASRGETTLEITDNGSPFDPSATESQGLGLDNLNRRVKALRGSWTCQREANFNVMRVKIFD
ncbi:ATP-binding protein [uncultured Duncaniella sp.]|nr:ATP-binding protein [uncultured Duncaniella sp.]